MVDQGFQRYLFSGIRKERGRRMIKLENHLGTIEVSEKFFTSLISDALSDCFGVAGLAPARPVKGRRKTRDQGESVTVSVQKDKLVINLHIQVTYGINISAIVTSIVHKISYTVEEVTGIGVAAVNVFVEGMQIG